MGRPQARSRKHTSKDKRKDIKTKHRVKDLDQIIVDLKPENAEKLEKQEVDPDLPGLGQHYCISCSRYFVDARALSDHRKTKIHKRRVKALKEDIYTGPQQLIDNGKPIMRDESN
uniref:C2H2-type domain-containing protein n=1 Tax=Vannella robusta TaxID=1487602 RepID=A0A7S4I0P6_9EUKA